MRNIVLLSLIFIVISELSFAERLPEYSASENSFVYNPTIDDSIPVVIFQTGFRKISDFVFFGDEYEFIRPDSMLAVNCSEAEYNNASKKMSLVKDYYHETKVTAVDTGISSCIEYSRMYLLKSGLDKYVKIEKDNNNTAFEGAYFDVTALNGVSLRIPFDCDMNIVGVDYLAECSWLNFHLSIVESDYACAVFDLKNGSILKIKGNANAMLNDSLVVFTSGYFHGVNMMDGSVPTLSYVKSGFGKIIYLDLIYSLKILYNSDGAGWTDWIFSGYVVLDDESVFVKCSKVEYVDDFMNYNVLENKYYKIVEK